MAGGQRFCGGVVLGELGCYQLHFAAQHLERLVDLCKGFFEFLFALQSDLQTEIIRHSTTSLDAIWDNIVDEHLALRFSDAVVLFMAFPQIKQQTERREPHFVLRHM